MMVDNEPDFGDMYDIVLFFPGDNGCRRRRDVACNVSTKSDWLINKIP